MRKKTSAGMLNIRYAFLMMMFWTTAAAGYGYMTQMLQYKGFGETEIGVLNGVKLIATVFFQIMIGSLADRCAKKLPLKYMIAVIAAVAMTLTYVFYAVPLSFAQTLLLFIGFGASFTCISPLIDALSQFYLNHGQHLNYPVTRTAGSIAWAVSCVLFGRFCDSYGANRLILVQVICNAVLLLAVLMMDKVAPGETATAAHTKRQVHTVWYLLSHYPKYTWFLIGSAVMFMGYNLGTTFLINVIEGLGGNNTHYGMAEFVMAISEVPSAFIMLKCRKRIPMEKLMLCCAIFMTLKNAFAAYAGVVDLVIVSQSCEMLGFGLYYSGSVFFAGEMLPKADVVKGVSLINVATVGLGEGIGSLICGVLRSTFGLHGLMQTSVIVSAVAIICMCIVCKAPATRERLEAAVPL